MNNTLDHNGTSLREELGKRVLVLDGAMGTMLQALDLSEDDYRGGGKLTPPLSLPLGTPMKGMGDILSLTRPDVVRGIHEAYLRAGADIITANTFSSQSISLADYHCQGLVTQINRQALRLAKEAAKEYSTEDKPRFVIASIGPTNKSCSMSPDVANPALRTLSYGQLRGAYMEQMTALVEEGVDGLLIETVFDTLNAKAALDAAQEAMQATGRNTELLLSLTIAGKDGRTLSGQTIEALLASISHAPLLSVGLNCSFGAADMLPFLRLLSREAPYYVSAHPNAGLPNALGLYDQTPEMMLHEMRPFVEEGLVNIIGGCCGTTPEHIALLATLTSPSSAHHTPLRKPVPKPQCLCLSGMDALRLTPEVGFINVGERCNVAGSRKFLRLVKEGSLDEALAIARRQVEDGALVLDINMDDGLLDAPKEMQAFVNLIGSDPDIARVPLMIDSSDWQAILAALHSMQGKGIVNSISLKEGEPLFLSHARELRRLGAAVVVMAFDEQGQATTFGRRTEICERAYHLLVDEVGYPPEDIIFDPNVLAIATGMPEHDGYALDFLRATEWIKQHLPGAHVSGGVSNLSFAFRGNTPLREAMHAAFLYHARLRGMDFAIVNPASKLTYSDIPPHWLSVIEDALLHPSPHATERLMSLAEETLGQDSPPSTALPNEAGKQDRPPSAALPNEAGEERQREGDVSTRLIEAMRRGLTDNLEADLHEALGLYPKAVDIIEGPLMEGMSLVGRLFGEGKMFLPQVVKAARAMKKAVDILQPHIEEGRQAHRTEGRVLLATVRGDVHDIGKNIVSLVMQCNGFEVTDLGVMVPAEEIVEKAKELHPDIIGLSGLITPSLEEMRTVVAMLSKEGIRAPIMIGGATTSPLHTALRIAPLYEGPVLWVKDATANAPLAQRFLDPVTAHEAIRELWEEQERLRQQASKPTPGGEPLLSIEEARRRRT